MTNKKSEAVRIGIFIIIAFALMWIPIFIISKTIGYEAFSTDSKYKLFSMLTMFTPAVGCVLTRIITKEGRKESLLHLRLDGNFKWYILAMCLPAAMSLIGGITVSAVFGKVDFGEIFDRMSPMTIIGYILSTLGSAVVMSWICFGEELGWRGYLYPKLEKLTNAPAAAIIGGIIWGLWHLPLTLEGHNFGKDYPGYPWVGIGFMTLSCVCQGIFLMWVTKKTGSVYPAAIWHAVNNFGGSSLFVITMTGVDMTNSSPADEMKYILAETAPDLIVCAAFIIPLILMSKKKKQEQ